MRYWLVLMVLLLSSLSAASANEPLTSESTDIALYISQSHMTLDTIYEGLYAQRDSGIDFEGFVDRNTHIRGVVGPGGEIVLPQEPDSFKHLDIVENASLWQLWQIYGTMRGFTFDEFVRYNMDQHGYEINSAGFDPYRHSLDDDLSGWQTLYLDKRFSENYRDTLASAHENLSESIAALPDLDDGAVLYFIGEPYAEQARQDIETRLNGLDSHEKLEMTYTVADTARIDNTSLSLGALNRKLFRKAYTVSSPAASETPELEVLVTIVADMTVTVSYVKDDALVSQLPPGFFDTLVSDAKKLLDEDSSAGGVQEVIGDIQSRLVGNVSKEKEH